MGVALNGQTSEEIITGKVSFRSSQNIYVRFRSTSGISGGDTLYISSGDKLIPALKVENLSSFSCVCTAITETDLPVDHLIIAKIKTGITKPPDKPAEEIKSVTPLSAVKTDSSIKRIGSASRMKNLRGSISAISYSDFSNTRTPDSQKFRYTLSMQAENIADSKFSFESYLSFRHNSGEWNEVKNDLFSAIKVYNLSMRYDLDETSWFILGRKINPVISGMGATDGLQFGKSLKNFTLGLLAGTRPDYSDYGFNPDLFQYGAWVTLNTGSSDTFTGSTVAFVQQMNKFNTDRRFLYFQHTNSLLKNMVFFSSFEIDLYKLENDQTKSTFDLTGMFLSIRVKMAGRFTLSGSYDARKNVMYYETYKSFTDHLLNTELRKGLRLNANWRINKNIMTGVQTGYRYMKSDPSPSKNIYGYVTYSNLPGVNVSATISGTWLESAFMNGRIAGINFSRGFSDDKIQAGMGYHIIDYRLPENKLDIIQHTSEMHLSVYFIKTISLSVYYEGVFEKVNTYNRIYLQLRKRF